MNNHQIGTLPGATVSELFGHGWATLKRYFPELILLILLQTVVSLPVGLAQWFLLPVHDGDVIIGLFSFLYGFIVLAPISFGCSWVYLKAVRGDSFRVTDIFFAFQQIGQVLLANILVVLIIVAGFFMFIIPGIVFACKLSFVPYLVMDRKLTAADAIRESWNMTRGFGWKIFGMAIISFFIIMLGIICLIVGVIPAALWISLTFAALYRVISARSPEPSAAA